MQFIIYNSSRDLKIKTDKKFAQLHEFYYDRKIKDVHTLNSLFILLMVW